MVFSGNNQKPKIGMQVEKGEEGRTRLSDRIAVIAKHCEKFKIGLSAIPIQDAQQYADTYTNMVIMFKTGSLEEAQEMIGTVIGRFVEDSKNDNLLGERIDQSEKPPYYIYVVFS